MIYEDVIALQAELRFISGFCLCLHYGCIIAQKRKNTSSLFMIVSRPILESKSMRVIFKKRVKKGKIFENLGKNGQNFENILQKGSLMRATIACMKLREYALTF